MGKVILRLRARSGSLAGIHQEATRYMAEEKKNFGISPNLEKDRLSIGKFSKVGIHPIVITKESHILTVQFQLNLN